MVMAFQIVLLIVIMLSALVGIGQQKEMGSRGAAICISSVAAFMTTLLWF